MKSGEQIETAIIGREGVVGGWVSIEGVNTNTQSTVQVEGSAWQISTAKFLELYKASDTFRSAMNTYQGVVLFQAQQSAGCHAIDSSRGKIKILNREGLEECACECYAAIRERIDSAIAVSA